MESLSWLQLLISGGLPVVAIFVQGMLLSRQRVGQDKIERSKLIWTYELEKLKQLEHNLSVILDFTGHYQIDLQILPVRYGKGFETALSEIRLAQLSFSEYENLSDDLFVFLERYTLLVDGDESAEEKRRLFREMTTTGSEIVMNCRKVLLGEKTKPLSAKVIDRNRSVTLKTYRDEQDGVVAGQAE